MAKDAGMVDAITAQVLLYPSLAVDSSIFESHKLYGEGDCFLSEKEAQSVSHRNLSGSAIGLNDSLASPLLNTIEQLKDLPSTLILSDEFDIFRDRVEAYGANLLSAGVYTVAMRVLIAYMSEPIPEIPQYKFTLKLVVDFIKDRLDI